jgi:hypothetical protein
VLDQHVDFLEASFVEQNGQTFARAQLSLRVLIINTLLPATEQRPFLTLTQQLQ